jgi:hypothetical protein
MTIAAIQLNHANINKNAIAIAAIKTNEEVNFMCSPKPEKLKKNDKATLQSLLALGVPVY